MIVWHNHVMRFLHSRHRTSRDQGIQLRKCWDLEIGLLSLSSSFWQFDRFLASTRGAINCRFLSFVRRSYGDRAVDRQSLLVFDDDSLRFARSSERVEVTSYPLHFDDMTTDLCEGSGQPDCRTLFLFDDFIVVPHESE